jgi:hypothetical protein
MRFVGFAKFCGHEPRPNPMQYILNFKLIMSEFTWQDVARFCKVHGNGPTYIKYKSFFVGETNPRRKLRTISNRLETNQPEFLHPVITIPAYGIHIDQLLEEKVKHHMLKNNNEMSNKIMRVYLVDLLEKHAMFDLLVEHGGDCIFERDWAARSRKRWGILKVNRPGKTVIDERVEMTTDEFKRMMQRTRDAVRRKPNDPLPCKVVRLNNGSKKKMRYEDEDEEDCWENTLPGGHEEYQRLSLDDRLMLPCSIRSKYCMFLLLVTVLFWSTIVVNEGLCPQLQELFHLSTSNEYSLPFPLKGNQCGFEEGCLPLSADTDSTEFQECIATSEAVTIGICQSSQEWSIPSFRTPVPLIAHNRRPLFEDIVDKRESGNVRSSFCSSLAAANGGKPIGRHQLLYHAAASRCGVSICSPPQDNDEQTTPWPTESVIRDSRVTSSRGLFGRYTDIYDIQSRLPWAHFKERYHEAIDSFNRTAGSGSYCQRVVIHAHHMACGQGTCQPLQFGENMPKIGPEKLAVHFRRAVECTGLNLSLLAVPISCLSMFDAVSCCMYALRSDVPPRSALGLLKSCITWMMKEKNVLKYVTTTEVSGCNISHSNISTTILDAFCEGIVSSDISAAAWMGRGTSVSQRLILYKKHLINLSKIDECSLLKFAGVLSKLNCVFVQVLCELYCETVTVIDCVRGAVKTYTSSGNRKNIPHRNLFIHQVNISGEYYYGVVDNDECMTNKMM